MTPDGAHRRDHQPRRAVGVFCSSTGEQTFALTLIQHDPHCDPELLIEVTDTADPDGLHVLTLPEIKALAETLLIEYLKAAALLPAARNPSTTIVETTGACHMP
ncbi:MAG: hypothetical protein ACRDR6_29895 [Pseudonocardiaceae bacterium]